MNQKKFLVWCGSLGFIVPLILSTVIYGTGMRMGGWNIHVFGLFWISYIFLMGLDTVQSAIGLVFACLFIVSVNVGYYVFLGWLFWQGKTKNKLFYLALPIVIYFAWSPLYKSG